MGGFTNQIISFILSIMIAKQQGHKVIIVDNFLNDFSKDSYTPISEIIDIDSLNHSLIQMLNVVVVDKNSAGFDLLCVKYGTFGITMDITEDIKSRYFKNNCLYIDNRTWFDGRRNIGDNLLFVNYRIGNYVIEEIYPDVPIQIDIATAEYIHNFVALDDIYKYFDASIFETILKKIRYQTDFANKANKIEKYIKTNHRTNVIHLRVEDDAIKHWSVMNNMSEEEFKDTLETKYIELIQKFMNKDDEIIILSQSLTNRVVDFLRDNNYMVSISEKYFEDREKNAIVDLLLASRCNHVFLGCFNCLHMNGSTFSYYIAKTIEQQCLKIGVDIDRVHDDVCMFH